MNLDTVVCADALEFMRTLPDASIDMVLCDLPYGTTACSWDEIIPFAPMWEQFRRVTKPRAAIVLTASQPFTTKLIASNLRDFKYLWYWRKTRVTNVGNAKRAPLRVIEDICVFNASFYYPQGIVQFRKYVNKGTKVGGAINSGGLEAGKSYFQEYTNYPLNILHFDSVFDTMHPTQKPVALFEYLIRTYTQAGDVVLDCCMGSGTTAIAARNTGRHFIGCDNGTDEKTGKLWATIANERLAKPWQPALLEG